MTAPRFKNFIAGDWVAPSTGEYFDNRNPADWNDLIGEFPRSGAADLQRAIASAKRGFAQWSKTPAPIRGQVLQRVGQLLVERKADVSRAMTREMGKVLAETGGDVQEGIDTAFYAATEGRRLFGRVVPSELRNKWAMSYRRPIGIAGLITPFNFPLAIPTWKMFPALLCGNAVIFKPAEDVPHTAHLLVEILLEAGLPPEVVQLGHGQGSVVGRALVEHPDIPVISFTGSTETGSTIGATCGKMHKRLSLEMGGSERRWNRQEQPNAGLQQAPAPRTIPVERRGHRFRLSLPEASIVEATSWCVGRKQEISGYGPQRLWSRGARHPRRGSRASSPSPGRSTRRR